MKNRGFDFGDFEITKREILASISIIAMMLLIGFVISGRISNYIPKERHIPELKLIGLGTMQEAKNKDVRKLHF